MATKKNEGKPVTSEAVVMDKRGQHIRTYTREVHGDDFEECAKEMAAQHGGGHIEVR